MNKVVYLCVGTCKAEVSEEQYKGGLTNCGGEGCTLKGHAFEKRIKCEECGTTFHKNEVHKH